jgi:predicted kinase
MSQQLFVMRGVQGSGKSTFANDWVRKDPLNRARVNRDDIRFTVFGSYELPPELELAVTRVEHAMIAALLAARKSVVVDNVNLRAKYVKEYLKIAEKAKVVVLHKDFPIELEEALRRNANRDRKVPARVIEATHKRYIQSGKFPEFPQLEAEGVNLFAYIPNETLPKAVILDVDGTAMHMSETRGPYDWHKVLEDEPNNPVIETVHALAARGYKIIVMSGRDEVSKEDTLLSLEIAGVPVHEIFMRPEGDRRKDSIIKHELFDAHIRNRYNVLLALDDRQNVVDHYRQVLELPVFQVNYGDF